jgi:gamma-glutamylcyclotransferase
MMKTHLYFAYGANTNLDSMAHRCPAALDLGPATLPNHYYRFSRHADVVPSQNQSVEGVLWDITDDCLAALDLFEGYPDYYDRKTVQVMHRGQLCDALVYFMQPGLNLESPSTGYLKMVMQGFAEHNIPTTQINQALAAADRYEYALENPTHYE